MLTSHYIVILLILANVSKSNLQLFPEPESKIYNIYKWCLYILSFLFFWKYKIEMKGDLRRILETERKKKETLFSGIHWKSYRNAITERCDASTARRDGPSCSSTKLIKTKNKKNNQIITQPNNNTTSGSCKNFWASFRDWKKKGGAPTCIRMRNSKRVSRLSFVRTQSPRSGSELKLLIRTHLYSTKHSPGNWKDKIWKLSPRNAPRRQFKG